ncbi:MAG: hypothetical protein HXX20_12835 [Chloroflexi bacterium]|nr:hypothetical protein [Chloroflexota bacterium]
MKQKRRFSASLGCLTLIAVFFLAVSAFGLAYQAKPAYKIEVGSRLDEPYVLGFEAKEPAEAQRGKEWDGFDYRWARSESKIDLPGLGSQPLTVTLRVSPGLAPKPYLKILVNEKHQVPDSYLVMVTSEDLYELSFPVPADWFADGNLHLKLQSAVWVPAEVIPGNRDYRKLGILLDWFKVEPAQQTFFPLIRPPDDIFIPLVISSMLVLLIFLSIGLTPPYALLLSGGLLAGASYWLVFDRLNLTELISRDFVRSIFFMWVAVFLVAEIGSKVYKVLGLKVTRREMGWLAAIFLFQFVMLWGFMQHPMFTSSDLGLNIHRLQDVMRGNLLFPQELPNGQLAPYPPAYYLLLLPFTNLVPTDDVGIGVLIKVASSLLQASEVFFIFYLSGLFRHPPNRVKVAALPLEREWEEGSNWAGLLAAAFYTVCKYPYYIFSQGNHTNLFGVFALLLFICVTTGTLSYLSRMEGVKIWRALLVKPLAQPESPSSVSKSTKTYSSAPLATTPTEVAEFEESPIGPSLAQRYFSRLVERWRRQVWPLLAITLRYLLPLALLVLVFTAHYGLFLFANGFMLAYVAILGLWGGRAGRRDALYLLACYVSALLMAFLLYYRLVLNLMSSPGNKAQFKLTLALVGDIILWLWRNMVYEFGLIVVLAALTGAILWLIRPGWRQLGRGITPLGGALLALTLTVITFALLSYLIGLESRFQLYLLPLVALAAGAFFGRLWRSGWAGVLLVSAIFLFQFLEVLSFWLSRMTYYF